MHCPECGFVNSEGANYCQKCGAFLSDVQQESDDTTAAWQLDDTGDIQPVDPEVAAVEAPPEVPVRAERQKSLTIGAVCKQLEREFPDISISKIRYLEDQKLLAPRRTQGGYRLYAPADVSRLRTILRLQRDEFLPLRVIRQELAAGRARGDPLPPGKRQEPRAPRL